MRNEIILYVFDILRGSLPFRSPLIFCSIPLSFYSLLEREGDNKPSYSLAEV